jgi:hypothetical protein
MTKKKDTAWTKKDHHNFTRGLEKRLKSMEDKYTECQNTFSDTLTTISDKLDGVQNTLNNVKVNGRMGLQESIQDIYTALGELKAEDNKKLLNRPLKEFFKGENPLGKVVVYGLVYLFIATTFHLLGIRIDFLSLGQMILKAFGLA